MVSGVATPETGRREGGGVTAGLNGGEGSAGARDLLRWTLLLLLLVLLLLRGVRGGVSGLHHGGGPLVARDLSC